MQIMDARLNLDKEALEQIFLQENVATVPVSIVSVVGPSRTGKSFLLSIFLKQLNLTCNSVSSLIQRSSGSFIFTSACPSVRRAFLYAICKICEYPFSIGILPFYDLQMSLHISGSSLRHVLCSTYALSCLSSSHPHILPITAKTQGQCQTPVNFFKMHIFLVKDMSVPVSINGISIYLSLYQWYKYLS